MKILYGVQATGNGHITRARALNKHLKQYGIEVDYLFSGRAKEDFFDMEEFGSWQCKRGLTFIHEAGDIKILRTIQQNNVKELWADISRLNLSPYDLILTDFEPITAWAAKRQKKTCIGVGHQYAFNYKVPRRGDTFISRLIMKNFAPASQSLGLHWHHFGQPILPPIAETHHTDKPCDPNKIVVYLGFEEPNDVIRLLEPFEDHLFTYYAPFKEYENRGHIQLKPLSREGFKQDLATSGGVICNAGFELSSEAIQLGKKLLVKPLAGQIEQLSNAKALEELNLAKTMTSLDTSVVKDWLKNWQAKQVTYPDVAKAIAKWIADKNWTAPDGTEKLAEALWQQVSATGVEHFDAPLQTERLA